ncbi:Uu.00g120550.m01.CDS01 [Anthostomella pinea]|uniref:Uu.00g120550.m01.CDS01 n=1 Tax=Anthostomella pinea TaxID=933095 RepID=A0AAI8VHI4_9PEZI|nr:Uu.00g120550.m01.CDS01 [Anthostomella pinea]
MANTENEFRIWLDLQSSHHPAVFDLSGNTPFELHLQARRISNFENDPRELSLLTAGSLFDLPTALDKGLMELVDENTGNVVDQDIASLRTRPDHPKGLFLTLPTDSRAQHHPVQSLALNAATHLRAMVEPGHTYRLRVRDNDLGVQWWGWQAGQSSPSDSTQAELPPGEPRKLVSNRCPPELSIGLSLAEDPGSVKVVITNPNGQPITVATRGPQMYISDSKAPPDPGNRITDGHHPDVRNLEIVDAETGQDLLANAVLRVYPVAGGSGGGRGWSRGNFLTLAPGEQVTCVVGLPVQRLSPGKEYLIRLRPAGCWWTEGTVDDLFGEGNGVIRRWSYGPTLPLMLESDDKVSFRLR